MVTNGTAGRTRRILVIDDDQELCELLVEYLKRESFAVDCVHEGEAGLDRALAGRYDVVILDVMLPILPGFEILRRLRRRSAVPVLMLTARGEDVDRIVGLELGADDYLPKPFNPRELVARIHAILRRAAPEPEQPAPAAPAPRTVPVAGDPALVIEELAIHPARREVTFREKLIPLTTVEFDVLCVLARSAGRVVRREEISKGALGRSYGPYDRSVDMHVMNLRRKLQSAAGERISIKTVRSAGYMLVAPPSADSPGIQATNRPGGRNAQ
jgi:two-component system, OmpR family, response regulator CpxR